MIKNAGTLTLASDTRNYTTLYPAALSPGAYDVRTVQWIITTPSISMNFSSGTAGSRSFEEAALGAVAVIDYVMRDCRI